MTSVKQISYDLVGPSRNYPGLYEAIKKISGWWAHPLESIWLVKSDASCRSILERLLPFVDGDDKIFVTTITDWSSYNLEEDQI